MSHPQDNASKESARVKQFNRNKWFFSLGGIGRDMSYALVGTFLLTYLQFGVSMTLAQFTTLSLLIGVLGRVWDAVNDPVMGSLIENSHFKWGKFKPWIFIGALFTGVCILLMFNGRFFTGWAFVAYMIAVYLLWEMAYTMNDIGYWSMLPSLTSVKKERDQVSMLTVAFAAVGAIITILLAKFFVPILPFLLAFSAGAMLYVVVEELIPEMSEGEHSHLGVLSFAAGFTLMMVLDVALG